jgi:hypothetical protein
MSRMTYVERAERFDARLAATMSGPDADQAVAGMLPEPALDLSELISVAHALGGIRGVAGSAALRTAFGSALERMTVASKSRKPMERDLICTCVIALARREREAATDVYMMAARHDNAIIRTYGLGALAVVGDDRAWEEVMARLGEILRRKVGPDGNRWDEAASATEYLARHAARGSARAVRLVMLLRDRWRNLGDARLIEQWWPGVGPGGRAPEAMDLPHLHAPEPWW